MKHKYISEIPQVKIVTITPQEAEFYLGNYNIKNRNIKTYQVKRYVKKILDGSFVCSPDAITFENTGVIRNGQHRLQACANSGKTIESLVYYGAPAKIAEVTDTGSARSLQDILKIVLNVDANSIVTQIARNYYLYSKRNEENWGVNSLAKENPAEIADIIESNIEALTDIAKIVTGKSKRVRRVGFLVAIFEYYKQDQEKALQFLEEVANGCAQDAGKWTPKYPPKQLLDWFEKNANLGNGTVKGDFGKSVHAIQFFHKGLSCSKLRELPNFAL